MNPEEKFLRSRQAREEQKAKHQPEIKESDLQLFFLEFSSLASETVSSLQKNDIAEAESNCERLQRSLNNAMESIKLPSHELRLRSQQIIEFKKRVDELRSAVKPQKRFAFSSKGPELAKEKGESMSSCAELPAAEVKEAESIFSNFQNRTLTIRSLCAVFIRNCSGCHIRVLPTNGSVFVSECVGCVIYVASHQLRIKNTKHSDFYVWCRSTPIIEDSQNVRFGGYTAWKGLLDSEAPGHGKLTSHISWTGKLANMTDEEKLCHSHESIDDFHWLKRTQSPHWSLIEQSQWHVDCDPVTEFTDAREGTLR